MSDRHVQLRERAAEDVDAIVRELRAHRAEVASAFVDSLEDAVVLVGRWPHAGSSRFADEIEVPGLRVLALRGFPHLLFYVPFPDRIEIWRVLHSRRDIAAVLRTGSP